MARYTRTPVSTLQGINNELAKVELAMKDTLDRKGVSPNFMDSNLDMNSGRILNLPAPINDQEPLRLGDVSKDNTGASLEYVTSVIKDLNNVYTRRVANVTALKALAVDATYLGNRIKLNEFHEGSGYGEGEWEVVTGETPDEVTVIESDYDTNIQYKRVIGIIHSLSSFGAKSNDASAAAYNSNVLEKALSYVASGVNNFQGGTLDLGKGDIYFGEVVINETWGWNLLGRNNKTISSGPWRIKGCAGFTISDIFAYALVKGANDGFLFEAGEVTSERNHNFVFNNVSTRNFDSALHAVYDISQCWFNGGQHGGNNKSVDFESGFTADHIYFNDFIFADHAAGSTAFDVRCNNWRLNNAHFETNHGDTATVDLYAAGQACAILGGTMTQSGGVELEMSYGMFKNVLINRCSHLVAINSIAGEIEVEGNTIRWDTNVSAGQYDGTGKTGIKGKGLKFSNNVIKRSEIAIHTTGTNMEVAGNFINDAITAGYKLDNAKNIKIKGGTVTLNKAGSFGVLQNSGSGEGCSVDTINWNLSAGERYSFASDRILVRDSGEFSPEGVIYGATGSTFNRVNNAVQGRNFYTKITRGGSNNGWMPEGIAVASASAIGDASNSINTEDKRKGIQVLNSDNMKVLTAESTSATGRWFDATGAVSISPS